MLGTVSGKSNPFYSWKAYSKMNLIWEYHHFMSFQLQRMCNTNIHTTNAYSPTKSTPKLSQGKTFHVQKQYTNCNNVPMYKDQETHVEKNFCRFRLIFNAHRYWNGSFLALQHPHLWQQKMKPSNWHKEGQKSKLKRGMRESIQNGYGLQLHQKKSFISKTKERERDRETEIERKKSL